MREDLISAPLETVRSVFNDQLPANLEPCRLPPPSGHGFRLSLPPVPPTIERSVLCALALDKASKLAPAEARTDRLLECHNGFRRSACESRARTGTAMNRRRRRWRPRRSRKVGASLFFGNQPHGVPAHHEASLASRRSGLVGNVVTVAEYDHTDRHPTLTRLFSNPDWKTPYSVDHVGTTRVSLPG